MNQLLATGAQWGHQLWNFIGDNAANIIALVATAFVAYQAWLTRRHNRLSVRPHLQIHTTKRRSVPDGPYLVDQYMAELRNDGLGPAVITNWRFLLDGVEQAAETAQEVEDIIKKLVPNFISITTRHQGEDQVMRANDAQILLEIKLAPNGPEQLKALETQLARLNIVIEYSSMYGEKLKPLDTRE